MSLLLYELYFQYRTIKNTQFQVWILNPLIISIKYKQKETVNGKAVPLHAMEALGGERRYRSYSFSTSALDRGEWSASRPGRAFIPGEMTPGTHCTGGWVGPRAGLDTEARGKTLCPRRESNPDRPVVQPVVRHYTAWATRLLKRDNTNTKTSIVGIVWSHVCIFRFLFRKSHQMSSRKSWNLAATFSQKIRNTNFLYEPLSNSEGPVLKPTITQNSPKTLPCSWKHIPT
jgi:hypothetical protein